MVDVTLAMEISRDQALMRDAIESALGQSQIDLELLLLGNIDSVGFPVDDRVRLIHHPTTNRPLLPVEFLRRVTQHASAPLLLCLQPHQHLLPGALAPMVTSMRSDERIEMMCALQFDADERGHVSRAAFHQQWADARSLGQLERGDLARMLNQEYLPGNIRLYRSSALRLKILHLAESRTQFELLWQLHHRLNAVTYFEPVCMSLGTAPALVPVHRAKRYTMKKLWALLLRRPRGQESFGRFEVTLHVLGHLCRNNPIVAFWCLCRDRFLFWQVRRGLSQTCYSFFVRLFSRWPIPRHAARETIAENKKIGYYIWQYPVRSQSFVQREVAALLKAGEDVVVFTEIEAHHDYIDALKPHLAGSSIRNGSDDETHHTRLKWKLFRSAPWRYIRIRFFVLGRNYHANKSWWLDQDSFNTAVRLANTAREMGVGHIHSP